MPMLLLLLLVFWAAACDGTAGSAAPDCETTHPGSPDWCGDDCDPSERGLVAVEAVCSAPSLAAGEPLWYAVLPEHFSGCAFPECTVDLSEPGVVALVVDRLTCWPTTGDGCLETPEQWPIECYLPTLGEGTYSVRVNGAERGTIVASTDSQITHCSVE